MIKTTTYFELRTFREPIKLCLKISLRDWHYNLMVDRAAMAQAIKRVNKPVFRSEVKQCQNLTFIR